MDYYIPAAGFVNDSPWKKGTRRSHDRGYDIYGMRVRSKKQQVPDRPLRVKMPDLIDLFFHSKIIQNLRKFFVEKIVSEQAIVASSSAAFWAGEMRRFLKSFYCVFLQA